GEGYGSKIQGCGSRYLPDSNSFILFDVLIGNWWLQREDVADIAGKLFCDVVPVIFTGVIEHAIMMDRERFNSTKTCDSSFIAEGLILQPYTPLFKRKGKRVITKIKHRDFKNL